MDKHFEYVIVGQGIAGTLLHYLLSKEGKQVLILDKGHDTAASKVASGIINPITGRKYVKSWMYETFFPVAKQMYQELGKEFGVDLFSDHGIVRVLSSINEENIWYSKSSNPDVADYFLDDNDNDEYKEVIKEAASFGEVKGGAKADLNNLIQLYRKQLEIDKLLLEIDFIHSNLKLQNDGVWNYNGYTFDNIIFCEGWQLKQNPFFNKPGQEPAKGEVLIVRIKNKKITKSIKKKVFITPLHGDLYWVGSTYEWDFADHKPTEDKKEYLINALDEMLNCDYEIVDHWAGIRPTTLDRRPLLGKHPEHDSMYVFNGLGTKGASLAPYWAIQMVSFILENKSLLEEVKISRFS